MLSERPGPSQAGPFYLHLVSEQRETGLALRVSSDGFIQNTARPARGVISTRDPLKIRAGDGARVEGVVRRLHSEHRASCARCDSPPATLSLVVQERAGDGARTRDPQLGRLMLWPTELLPRFCATVKYTVDRAIEDRLPSTVYRNGAGGT